MKVLRGTRVEARKEEISHVRIPTNGPLTYFRETDFLSHEVSLAQLLINEVELYWSESENSL